MRRIHFYDNQHVDIVILDEVGSFWVKYCLPKNCSSIVIGNRSIFPALKSFKFFILFAKFFISTRRPGLSSICALITIISPSVIVTFIDNFSGLGHIQSLFPDIKVIAIQNAMRNRFGIERFIESLKSISKNTKSEIDLPIYFGFGDYEKEIFNAYSLNIKQYIPNGSIKMGLFNKYNLSKSKRKGGIRFISQYRPKVEKSNEPIFLNFYKIHKEILQNIHRFSISNDIEFKIVLYSEKSSITFDSEIEYYDNIFGKNQIEYQINNYQELSSYTYCNEGDIVIHMNSSLGFEFFGNGHKVIFGNTSNEMILSGFHEEELYLNIPKECLLLSNSYEEISNKIDYLLNISDKEYSSLIQNSANYFMKFDGETPLSNIQKYIDDLI